MFFGHSFLSDGSVDLVGRALASHTKFGVRILAPKNLSCFKRVVNISLKNARQQGVFHMLKNSHDCRAYVKHPTLKWQCDFSYE